MAGRLALDQAVRVRFLPPELMEYLKIIAQVDGNDIPTPAWECQDCGAVVVTKEKHDAWHERIVEWYGNTRKIIP